MNKRLLLVDGSSYLYRAFHALPDLRSPQGEPTGAMHGILAMLRRLRADFPADYAACVFDARGKTFRDDLYADYKANRASMPEDLAKQVEPIHVAVRAEGWPILMVEGIEADDVIGTLCREATGKGIDVIVSTGDKDLAQLVNQHVTLVNTMSKDGKPEMLDPAGVVARFGVPPERIVDYLALIGDTVDNVPGVDKVGPKTAVKWLTEHGSLDAIIAAADGFKGVTGENLRRAVPQFPLTRELLTVKCDCDLSAHCVALEALLPAEPDAEALRGLYERYGFRTWLRDMGGPGRAAGGRGAAGAGAGAGAAEFALVGQSGGFAPGTSTGSPGAQPVTGSSVGADDDSAPDARTTAGDLFPPAITRDYECVLTEEALAAWIARIDAAELTCVDTETTSLDPMRAEIVGLSLSVEPGRACYIPLAHRYADAPAQLDREAVLALLKPWFEDSSKPKLGQNLKYDRHVLLNHGIALAGVAQDTLLESYVLESHRSHDMDSMALRHLNETTITYEQVAGKGASQICFDQVAIDRATEYAAEDADITLRLHRHFAPQFEGEAGLRRIYEEMELPVAEVLARIERHGVLVDCEALAAQSHALGQRILELEQECYDAAGQPFNIGSPKQIGELLFGKLGLPVVKKTPSGAPSTDEEVLQKLAEDYPLPKLILEHRGLAKLKSTYTDKLPRMVNPATGRVHTNYAQAVAVTGRLASNEPNLQNIPIRTPEGRRVREAFIAAPGHVIVSADYSQIELRIMAHIADDANLKRAFTEGIDVHRATAAEIFGIDPEMVSNEQRRYAKVINFGLIYGMSAFGLAANLGIGRDAAKLYIDRYFTRYPGVARYMEETRRLAKTRGYVETVFGRRLWLPEINSPNGPRRQGAERAAINAPMQGTAADLIKLAMIATQKAIDAERWATRMVMQVHDELVFEVPDSELEMVRRRVPELMAGVASLSVPLLAEIGAGPNWEAAH
ncbi:DNA polymerase I [Derxia gummosa]|uniref:DNA polymerase I n=1 Tax=Derxia gummosa DSM 723 TaxID=1121388 RepID=A0A8B6X1X3_9BURK|nr:DNA polymerase I [Derxia gummosa]